MTAYNVTMADQKANLPRPERIQADFPTWNVTEAKTQLSQVIKHALEGKPQRIVRSGRDAVVVVSEAAFERATRRGRSVVELFSALRGADLDLDRDRDYGRETPL